MTDEKSTNNADKDQHRINKGYCRDCDYYHNCPRMTGSSICYGKKQVRSTRPDNASSFAQVNEQKED